MAGAFERLAKSVLNRLGQDALLLSGEIITPCRVNVEHGVQISGTYDDAVFERTVATFDKGAFSPAPRVGDRLEHPAGVFTLDGLLADNGFTLRFTLQPVSGD
jgi:hypothetical protein